MSEENDRTKINVPSMGQPEMMESSVTKASLDEILGGTFLPSQGFIKAMARLILRLQGKLSEDGSDIIGESKA